MLSLDSVSNRQLALILAVQAEGDRARSNPRYTETLADKYEKYLETGTMGR